MIFNFSLKQKVEEIFDVDPWMKKIILILTYLFIGASLLIPFGILYLAKHPFDDSKRDIELFSMRHFEGKVKKKYIDINDHSGNKILFYNGEIEGVYQELADMVEENDSLSKKEGVLFVEIYKGGKLKKVYRFKN